jgi:transcriptional regulator with XRE-family HTH domain
MALTLWDQLREEIKRGMRTKNGPTQYAIAKRAGVDRSALSRFLRGKSDIGARTMNDLCQELGLVLKRERRRRVRDVT